MLRLHDVTKTYGTLCAVDHLSLEIARGEFFGLLGPNGAGKTTTIRMISTLTPKTSGSIELDGESIDRDVTTLKRRIGVVPQGNNLEVELTAWENLELHGRLYGMPREHRRRRIDELLEFTELAGRKGDIVKNFSGGMKRKVMIARGLMHHPDVVLLDEPSVGLDASARRRIWDLLRALKSDGVTVLLTTHYIEEAEMLCDRVGLMDDGRLVECATPTELIRRLGDHAVDQFDGGHTTTEFFATRDEAGAFAAGARGGVSIRRTNLEDVFLSLTSRRVAP